MLGKRRSYTEAVQSRRKLARRLGALFLLFVSYELISGLFLASYAVKSSAMAPAVLPGDRIIASPLAFGPSTLVGKLPGISKPGRGDIVLVEPNYVGPVGFWARLFDSFVRFVTFQLVSPERGGKDPPLPALTLQRVVGLPGDTIQMDDFVFKVKQADSDQFLTEFELSSRSYDISHDAAPDGWKADLPGSGHLDARALGPDEFFLSGDARSSSSDSRLWGPVHAAQFRAMVLLRYWPLSSIGAL